MDTASIHKNRIVTGGDEVLVVNLVVTAIPSWLTFWAVSVTLTYAGFVASAIASAMEN